MKNEHQIQLSISEERFFPPLRAELCSIQFLIMLMMMVGERREMVDDDVELRARPESMVERREKRSMNRRVQFEHEVECSQQAGELLKKKVLRK